MIFRATLLFLTVILTLPAIQAQPFRNWERAYFPYGINKVAFGMPYAQLRKKHQNTQISRDNNDSYRLILQEVIYEQEFIDVIFYLDKDGEQPLYQVGVIYPMGIDVNEVAIELYGSPNRDSTWWFEHPNGYPIKIWVDGQQLQIAAVLPQTEWDEED